jgi:hypothetical protein
MRIKFLLPDDFSPESFGFLAQPRPVSNTEPTLTIATAAGNVGSLPPSLQAFFHPGGKVANLLVEICPS